MGLDAGWLPVAGSKLRGSLLVELSGVPRSGRLRQPSFHRSTVMQAQVVDDQTDLSPARLLDQSGQEFDQPVGVQCPGINDPPRTALARHRAHDGEPKAFGGLAHHRCLTAWRVTPGANRLTVHAGLIAPEDLGSFGFGARREESEPLFCTRFNVGNLSKASGEAGITRVFVPQFLH